MKNLVVTHVKISKTVYSVQSATNQDGCFHYEIKAGNRKEIKDLVEERPGVWTLQSRIHTHPRLWHLRSNFPKPVQPEFIESEIIAELGF